MHPFRKFLLVALLWIALPCFHALGQGVHDLALEVTVSSEPLSSGRPFTLTLLITNYGVRDADDVRIGLSHEDLFFPGEELWYLSMPAGFETSDEYLVGFLVGKLSHLPANASVTYSFTAVALLSGNHWLRASAGLGEEGFFGGVSFFVSEGPGLITLEKPAYIIPEKGGGLINVRRLGGDYTSVAVSFATSNGTAIAHSDFVPAIGRLEFRPGELTKTIYIPTIYNPASACNTSLTLHLFNVEGGAFLLRYTNAPITIADAPPQTGYLRPVSAHLDNTIGFAATSVPARSLSADGRKVISVDRHFDFDPDGGGIQTSHIVLHDLDTRTSVKLSAEVSPRSYSGAVLSGAGNLAAFQLLDWEEDGLGYSILARHLTSTSNILIKVAGTNDSFESLTLSSNGTLLAYDELSWDFYETHVFAYDFLTGSNELISVATNDSKANDTSTLLAVNATGRYVVFQSWASDLVPNDTNGWPDIFLRDRLTGQTELISVNDSGLGPRAYPSIGPASITPDGRYVMFVSSQPPILPLDPPAFLTDVFVRDRSAGITRRASIEPARTDGEWFNANFGTMSDDARYVVYHSFDVRSDNPDDRRDVVNVYLTDMLTGDNRLITENCGGTGGGNAPSYWPWISGDGASVFFFSWASDLIPGGFWWGDTNLFRWERAMGRTSLVTANMFGTGGVTGEHTIAGLSHDGRVLAFSSSATNLVFNDFNWENDLFVWTAGERPALSIYRVGDSLTISWPAAPPSLLESKASDGDWTVVEDDIETLNDQQIYHPPIPAPGTTRFFRLRLQ